MKWLPAAVKLSKSSSTLRRFSPDREPSAACTTSPSRTPRLRSNMTISGSTTIEAFPSILRCPSTAARSSPRGRVRDSVSSTTRLPTDGGSGFSCAASRSSRAGSDGSLIPSVRSTFFSVSRISPVWAPFVSAYPKSAVHLSRKANDPFPRLPACRNFKIFAVSSRLRTPSPAPNTRHGCSISSLPVLLWEVPGPRRRSKGPAISTSGWRLSPAFDLNPNPEKPHHALALDDRRADPDLGVVAATCQYYHLDVGEATAIVSEVRSIVGEWQSRARAMHLPTSEIALMRNAFLE